MRSQLHQLSQYLTIDNLDTFGKKCRALVLEGGGDLGAYQAGVIRGMYEKLGDEAKYDVFSGVSAGAVNAITYSFFDKGQEEEATNFLRKFSQDVFRLVLFQIKLL